ncbi:metal-nicotianamine transporter YSL3-like [Gossypium australe]|uniref:Metal-nicotianamine transporter YSL3-like n=1 Tax=Gossypium australe TaxID=47621 RepID=A0A5B6WM21_9ROSI|nr:metal-nicotianamine transporter YSL3-like [Gossypium australe]
MEEGRHWRWRWYVDVYAAEPDSWRKELLFYFDFSMTYIGAGMICSHLVNLSLLLGAVLSWGVMWPLIGGLKGEWFPATLPALQLYQKAASRMVTRRRALQFSEDTIFDC